MRSAIHGAVTLMIVKARIEHYFKQVWGLESDLAEYKRKHGYCGGSKYGALRARDRAEPKPKKVAAQSCVALGIPQTVEFLLVIRIAGV